MIIFRAIKEYTADCYHDRLMKKAHKIGCVLADGLPKGTRKPFLYEEGKQRKLGSLWCYIQEIYSLYKITKMFKEDMKGCKK